MNKRAFILVIDSLGVGSDSEAYKFHDDGANTLKHIFKATNGKYKIPLLQKLGLCNLSEVAGNPLVSKTQAYYTKMHEASASKDTLTGHWEMMGLRVDEPFITFTEKGFPEELLAELTAQSGYRFIGNKACSGTEIIKELGERQLKTKELIIYTSADSVLQIAAHEEAIGLAELYRVCALARRITLKKEWRVGRVIARPFIGDNSNNFVRTANRHDYALDPPGKSVLEVLKENAKDVIAIGKINDIFNTKGITKAIHSESSVQGMEQTIAMAKQDFNGLCFVNLVDFDAKWGHRRNPDGYARELVNFDRKLAELLPVLQADDYLFITADHGNDPTWQGSDHTREFVPLLVYRKNNQGSGMLALRDTFSDLGATVADLFELSNPGYGQSFLSLIQ